MKNTLRKNYTILLIALVLLACITLVGCKKEEEQIAGGWETVFNIENNYLSEEEIEIFNNAKKDFKEVELEPIAIVGKQVVAGTNYMYLAKGYKKDEESKAKYKLVVIYHDLSNNSSITKVTDFDYTQFVNEDVDGTNANLAGGWHSESSGKPVMLDEKSQVAFDKATEALTGMTYKPIALLGKQLVAGNNYAILCFGEPSVNTDESVTSVYVVTIYEDLQGNSEFVSSCFVSLEQYT